MSASTAPDATPAAAAPGEPDPTGTLVLVAAPADAAPTPTVAKTRHPWRWVVSAVALILLAQFVHALVHAIEHGAYQQVIDRWGLHSEAVTESRINPPGLPTKR
ncbi:hypothetical protein [Nocardia gipuzkoensis]|uniref:hypothetical protein n=1 Tax=Nocardia gipuzkoensis TaxID=2749991 RepID=UPI0038CD0FD5